jgi:hypothetical protein
MIMMQVDVPEAQAGQPSSLRAVWDALWAPGMCSEPVTAPSPTEAPAREAAPPADPMLMDQRLEQ